MTSAEQSTYKMAQTEQDGLLESGSEGSQDGAQQSAVPSGRRFKSLLTVVVSGTVIALLAAGTYKGHSLFKAKSSEASEKFDYYNAGSLDSGYDHDAEDAEAEKNKEKWIQEDPADFVSKTHISLGSTDETECDDELNAIMVVPKCEYPGEGWPGAVIVPGRSGDKARHTIWSEMLAGRGIATMNFDMCPANKADQTADIMRAVNWMKSQHPGAGADSFNVNPNDITVIGYSAGGKAACNFLWTQHSLEVKNVISVAGINSAVYENIPDDKSIMEEENFPNFLAIQALDDSMMKSTYVETFVDAITKSAPGKGHAAIYYWGNHQPSMQTDFFHVIATFIKDPANYDAPRAYGDSWPTWKGRNTHYGSFLPDYEDASTEKSCWTNDDDHDDFLRALDANFWSGNPGEWSCMGLCTGIADCGYFELFGSKITTTEGDKINCVLYKQKCSKPTYELSSTAIMKQISGGAYTDSHVLSTCNAESPDFTSADV